MTWSVTHTIPYNSNANNHSAMVYLFDTVLAGKTGWTISAHPDASSFKRRAKFTVTNKVTNSNYTMYHWVNWQSTTPTGIYWYEDATFTTNPGDTATDTTTNSNNQLNWSLTGENWKFCTSSENSQSILVLKGGKVAFYWPGITSGIFWPDASWTAGSTDNKGTWVMPAIGWYYNSLQVANYPVATNTSAEEYMLIPDAGWSYVSSNQGYRAPGNYIATNFNWLYSRSTSTANPDVDSQVAFSNGGHTDVGVWMPSSVTNASDNRMPFAYSNNGMTMQVGSDYWYNPFTDLGRQGVVFNFGATDPLA
jgi:hypothetical protein